MSYQFLVHFWLLGVLSVYLVSVVYSAFIVPKALDNGPPSEDNIHKLTRALGALFYIIFPKGLIDHPGMIFSSWYGLFLCIEYHRQVLYFASNPDEARKELDQELQEKTELIEDVSEALELRITIAVMAGMKVEGSDTDKTRAIIDNVIGIFNIKASNDITENYH